MANEAIKVELTNNTGFPIRYACASGTAIAKGTLLILSDPRTVTAHSTGVGGVFAGIASMGKEATDYSTSISAWTDGIFEIKASGAITVGDKVKTSSAANYVEAITGAASGSIVVGTALETASDAEVINVRVRI